MQALQKQVGDRVKELRERKELSQEVLADICGLHRTYIGLIERGERNLSLATVEVVAQGLGVAVADLFSGIPVSAPPQKGKAQRNRTSSADIQAHLKTMKQILIEAKLTDPKSYDAAFRTIRKKNGD